MSLPIPAKSVTAELGSVEVTPKQVALLIKFYEGYYIPNEGRYLTLGRGTSSLREKGLINVREGGAQLSYRGMVVIFTLAQMAREKAE